MTNVIALAVTRTLAAELETVRLPLWPAGTGSDRVAVPPAPDAAFTAKDRDSPFGPTAAVTVVGRQAPAAVSVTVAEVVPAGIVPIDRALLPPDGTTAPATGATTSAVILTLAAELGSRRVPGLPAGTGRVRVVRVPVPGDALTTKVFLSPFPTDAVTTVSRQAPAPAKLTVTDAAPDDRPARAIEADLPDGTTVAAVVTAEATAEDSGAAEAGAIPRPVNPTAPIAIAERRTEPRDVRNDLLVGGVVE